MGNIDPTAEIHSTTIIHPWVVVGKHVRIGEFSVIGRSGLVARWNKKLDRQTRQESKAGVIIEDYVEIAAHCTVHRGTERHTVIGQGTFLGDYVNIGHDAKIGPHNLVINGTLIAGWVETGEKVFVGMGTKVRERVKIGDGAYVGMGSNVLSNLPPGTYGYGNPFKPQKKSLPIKKAGRYIMRRIT